MRIRILHLIKSLGRGGAEMLLPETLHYHNREAFAFYYAYFLPWKNQLVNVLEEKGVAVQLFPAQNNLQLLLQVRKLKAFVEQNKIDLIHCHLPWAGFAGRLLHLWTGIPVVYTEHNKQERYHPITSWLNQFSFNQQHMAIAVSEDVAVSIIKNIQPSIPVRLVKNAVDAKKFQPNKSAGQQLRTEWDIPTDAIVIGTVAVFRFQKRLEEWLEVFKAVSDKHPHVRAIIVGDGPLRKEVEEKAKQLNLQNKLLLPGLQTDVKPWLAAMDIFMMSSVFEGLPIALLEAMSMGCIPVCTAAGGIREVIEQDRNGLLVPVDDWRELIPSLAKLLADPSHYQSLQTAARETISQHYSMERMVEELETIYTEVYNKRPIKTQ